MTALKFHGPVLPSGEVRDLYVVGGHVTYEPQPGAELVAHGWILPGLVDAHAHIGLGPQGVASDELTEAQAVADRDAGALVVRDCGSATDTRWVQEREDLPHLIRAGRHIGRTARYFRGFADEVEPENLLDSVRRQVANSDGWIKLVGDWIDRGNGGDLEPSFPADDVQAAIALAHELGAKVTAHSFGSSSVADLITAGIDCIEHGTGLTTALIDQMLAQGTALVPTVAQTSIFPALAESAGEKYPAYGKTMTELFETRREVVMSAYEAGIEIFAGSDSAGIGQHGTLPLELMAMADFGIPAADVVAAASWKGRAWLGFTPDLREGAEADFVIYDRNPIDDLSVVLERPRTIVLRGKVIGR